LKQRVEQLLLECVAAVDFVTELGKMQQ